MSKHTSPVSLQYGRKVLKASVEKCGAKNFSTLLSLTIFRPKGAVGVHHPQGDCFAILMMIGSFERTDKRTAASKEEIQLQLQLQLLTRIDAVSVFP
jgi:hypothetical protein